MSLNYINLQRLAIKWWPKEIIKTAINESSIPLLLETFESFVGIMNATKPNIDAIMKVVQNSKISTNVFLKHLIVLADFGGESLSRIGDNFKDIFTKDDNGYYMEYGLASGDISKYYFKDLPCNGLSNKKLLIDKDSLSMTPPNKTNELIQDIIFILLFASSSTDSKIVSILNECNLITFINNKSKLSEYLKSHYITVSKINSGSIANSKGYALERYLINFLRRNLSENYIVSKKKVRITNREQIPFDIVIRNKNMNFFALEVSFQVTTNSTIERKGNEAETRYNKIKKINGFIGYIVDGAGNLKRQSAIEKLIKYSDGVYSLNKDHLKKMIIKIQEVLS